MRRRSHDLTAEAKAPIGPGPLFERLRRHRDAPQRPPPPLRQENVDIPPKSRVRRKKVGGMGIRGSEGDRKHCRACPRRPPRGPTPPQHQNSNKRSSPSPGARRPLRAEPIPPSDATRGVARTMSRTKIVRIIAAAERVGHNVVDGVRTRTTAQPAHVRHVQDSTPVLTVPAGTGAGHGHHLASSSGRAGTRVPLAPRMQYVTASVQYLVGGRRVAHAAHQPGRRRPRGSARPPTPPTPVCPPAGT